MATNLKITRAEESSFDVILACRGQNFKEVVIHPSIKRVIEQDFCGDGSKYTPLSEIINLDVLECKNQPLFVLSFQ